EAYQLYLKGDYFFYRFSKEDFEKARSYYQQAIDKDPNFALAWAALGDSYSAMAFEGYARPKEAMAKSHAAVTKALELDPSLAHAHLTMSAWFLLTWDWKSAEKEMKIALQ